MLVERGLRRAVHGPARIGIAPCPAGNVKDAPRRLGRGLHERGGQRQRRANVEHHRLQHGRRRLRGKRAHRRDDAGIVDEVRRIGAREKIAQRRPGEPGLQCSRIGHVDFGLFDPGQRRTSARQAQYGQAARLQFGRDGGPEATGVAGDDDFFHEAFLR
jgi:hypothetical protein